MFFLYGVFGPLVKDQTGATYLRRQRIPTAAKGQTTCGGKDTKKNNAKVTKILLMKYAARWSKTRRGQPSYGGKREVAFTKTDGGKKGNLRLSIRDLTYFVNYNGYSTFENSTEPFTVKWDSRVVRLSFSWRFGKAMKPVNRSEGGASDEINRVGGN